MKITHVLFAAALLVSPSLGIPGKHRKKTQPPAAVPIINNNVNVDNTINLPQPANEAEIKQVQPDAPAEDPGKTQGDTVPGEENMQAAQTSFQGNSGRNQPGQVSRPAPSDPLGLLKRVVITTKPTANMLTPPPVQLALKRLNTKDNGSGFLVMLDSLAGAGILDFPALLDILDPEKKLNVMKESSILQEELEDVLRVFDDPAKCQWDMSVGQYVEREAKDGPAQNRIQEEEKKEEKTGKEGKGKKSAGPRTGIPQLDKIWAEHEYKLPDQLPCEWNTDPSIRSAAILTAYLQTKMLEYDGKGFVSKNEPVPEEMMQKLMAAKSKKKKKTKKVANPVAQEKRDNVPNKEKDLDNEIIAEEVMPVEGSVNFAKDIDEKQREENSALYHKIRDELDFMAEKQRKQNLKTLQASYKIILKSLTRSAVVEIMTFAKVSINSYEILRSLEKDKLHMRAVDCYGAFNFINQYIAQIEMWKSESLRYSERAAQILPPQQRSMDVNEAEFDLLRKDKNLEMIGTWVKKVIKNVDGNKVTPSTDIKLQRIKLAAIAGLAGDITTLGNRFLQYIESNLVDNLKIHELDTRALSKKTKHWADFEKNLRKDVKEIKTHKEFFPNMEFLTTWTDDASWVWCGMELINLFGNIVFSAADTLEKIAKDKSIQFKEKGTREMLDGVLEKYNAIRATRRRIYQEMFGNLDSLFKVSKEYLVKLYDDDQKVLKEYADDILQGKVGSLVFKDTTDGDEEQPAWMQGHIVWFDAEEYLKSLLSGKPKAADVDTLTMDLQNDFQKKRKLLSRERERWMKKSFLEGNPVVSWKNQDDEELIDPTYIPYLTRWKEHYLLKPPVVSVLEKMRFDRGAGAVYLTAYPELKKSSEVATAQHIPVSEMKVLRSFHHMKHLHEHFDKLYNTDRPIIEERIKVLSNEVSSVLRLFVENASLRENAQNAVDNPAMANFLSHLAGPMHMILDFKPKEGAVLNGYHTDLFVRQFMAIEHLISSNADDVASRMIAYFHSIGKAAKGLSIGSPDDLADLEKARQSMQEIVDVANPTIVGSRIENTLEGTLKHITDVIKQLNKAKDPRDYWDELSKARENLRHLKVVIKRFDGLKTSNRKFWHGAEQAVKDINVALETIERTRMMLAKDHRSYPRPNALDHEVGPNDSVWSDSEERFGKHVKELYDVKQIPELLWWSNEYNNENREGGVDTEIEETQR